MWRGLRWSLSDSVIDREASSRRPRLRAIGRADERRVGKGRQVDEVHAVGESVPHLGRDPDRQPRLAGASGAGQGQQAAGRQQPRTASISWRRPTKLVGSRWQGDPHHRATPERREVVGQALDDQLDQAFWLVEVLELMGTQVAQGHAIREHVLDERPRRRRQEDLAALRQAGDAGGPMDVQARVTVTAEASLAGMQAHPDPHRRVIRPVRLGHATLSGDGGRDGLRGHRKDGEEAIALGADLDAAMCRQRARERWRHVVRARPRSELRGAAAGASTPRCR